MVIHRRRCETRGKISENAQAEVSAEPSVSDSLQQ